MITFNRNGRLGNFLFQVAACYGYAKKHNMEYCVNPGDYRDWETDRKSTRLNSSHSGESRMPSSA